MTRTMRADRMNLPKPARVAALAFALLSAACSKDKPSVSDADAAQLVFKNANIYTVDATLPTATAIAVRDGKIVALGGDAEVAALIGKNTQVVDLKGKLMLPAFQDMHTHPVWGGLNYSRCPLYDGNSPAEYQKLIAKCAADNPGTGWLFGVGWKDGLFAPEGTPDKKLLDEVVSDRPAAFANVGGHGLWVNSKGLEAAGITRNTEDPKGGRIDRDAKGEPNGGLQETAVELVMSKVSPPSDKERADALIYATNYLHGIGIVGLHDALVPIRSEDPTQSIPPGVPETYIQLTKSGQLKTYATLALAWDKARGIEQVPDLIAASKRLEEQGVEAKSVKFLLDGVPVQRTAALLEPYSDKPNERGELQMDEASLTEAVTQLDAAGFQVHIHAIGDAATHAAVNAFAKAREKNGPSDHRPLISHANLFAPEDLKRMADLGVIVVFQPLWASMDDYMVLVGERVGRARLDRTYPVASVMKAGAKVAYGSDWPVASANPFEGIEVAITRRGPGITDGPQLAPTEAITLEQAIENFTINVAFAGHREDRTGSLKVGKNADLVVLDRDVFKIPVTEIGETQVLLTLYQGTSVHGDLGSL